MFMAMTHSLLHASAENYSSPAGALREVDQHLRAHSSSDMFVTIFYALLDAQTQTLTYANAGHNPPLLRRATGEIEQLTRTGAALGIFEAPALSDRSLVLASGDSLVIHTDGVTDALNSQGEHYEMAHLIEEVASLPKSNAKLQLAHLVKDLNDFIQDTPPFDDITFFILSRDQD